MDSEPTNASGLITRAWQEDPEGWCRCSGLTERQAENLLDWLEAHGLAPREVSYGEGQGFTVRWHP
jgi:hypothetical protein